jgi:hypothetical protein
MKVTALHVAGAMPAAGYRTQFAAEVPQTARLYAKSRHLSPIQLLSAGELTMARERVLTPKWWRPAELTFTPAVGIVEFASSKYSRSYSGG